MLEIETAFHRFMQVIWLMDSLYDLQKMLLLEIITFAQTHHKVSYPGNKKS